jgi:hypothetical protein
MANENWIDLVLEECSHVETPRSWLWWSLVCSISAAAGNNYFLRTLKGAVIYKPNIYVMLLGESGLGKGFPINLSKNLVKIADVTRVIAGRSSIQAIVKELSLAYTREHKSIIVDSRGFIVNGELSTAIIQDPSSLTILTDLYDGNYNPEWTNLLKGSGAEKLKEPYITALFGSSPSHFYESVPQVNIEGGYIGRNLIVYEERRHQDSDLLDDDDSDSSSFPYEKFTGHLEKIANYSGRMIPLSETKKVFNTWRRQWRERQQADKTGFSNRVPDHVLKVAMCLALSRQDFTLIIEKGDIEEAIDRVTSLVYSNKRTTEGKGVDPLSIQTKMVLDFLLVADKNELKRKQLLTKGYGNYDAAVLDKVIDTLMEMGWIQRERFVAGSATDWIIRLTGEPLAQYKKFVADRKLNKGVKSG